MSELDDRRPETYYAPAERATADELEAERQVLLESAVGTIILESLPDMAAVINPRRQILAVNQLLLENLGLESAELAVGLRPGEAVQCLNAAGAPSGCGTGEACRYCGAVNAILESLQTWRPAVRECRIQSSRGADGGALDLRVHATPLDLGDRRYVMLCFRDISAEKRRRVLERVFFHDVLNTAGGVHGLSEVVLDPGIDEEFEHECLTDINRLSESLIEEVNSQRDLMAAESGELQSDLREVPVLPLLAEVVALYRYHQVADGRTLDLSLGRTQLVRTDPTLLRRVLGNLVKNALEATPPGGKVTVSAEQDPLGTRISIHNPGVMPPEVQAQLFQRSFSTKGTPGRGLGTYSVRLFTERYLAGKVTFVSREPEGTTFTVTLP